jgi:glycosyltransferase involved in cell wall biosynthesis
VTNDNPDVAARALVPTVVLCVYNGRQRIGAPLEALARQDCPDGAFEVIVVDNNSTDGTREYALGHPAVAAMRARGVRVEVVHEKRQGLMFARLAGTLAARTDVVCFLDDDNVPAPHYVAAGIRALRDRPDVGLLVSRLRPRFERTPPRAVRRRQHLFAINEALGPEAIDFGPVATLAPTLGAGLWVRRAAFLAAIPWETPERMIPDRVGATLLSGNDVEIGYLMGRAGHGRLYVPLLELDHLIPEGRLHLRYLTRLINGIIRSQATLDSVYVRPPRLRDRALAAARLAGAVVAAPVLALGRDDGLREAWFALVARYSFLQGPYGAVAARMRAQSRG